MAYYPLSQIVTNLYTNGTEFTVEPNNLGAPYIGYYWKSSQGTFFSGKTPQDSPSFQIYPLVANDVINTQISIPTEPISNESTALVINYNNVKQIDTSLKIYVPVYSPNIPTDKDYQIGEFRRYFCKKINELIYIEINNETYNSLLNQNKNILFTYYKPFNIPWKLTGIKKDVYDTNMNIVNLYIKKQKLLMFNMYLKEDYTKYYK